MLTRPQRIIRVALDTLQCGSQRTYDVNHDVLRRVRAYEDEWKVVFPTDLVLFITLIDIDVGVYYGLGTNNRLRVPGVPGASILGRGTVHWTLEPKRPEGEDYCIRILDENQWMGWWSVCWTKGENVCRVYACIEECEFMYSVSLYEFWLQQAEVCGIV